jgi:hypothetical protein
MTAIHRLPCAITRIDGGSHAATRIKEERSAAEVRTASNTGQTKWGVGTPNHSAEAITCEDGDRATQILQDAPGIESDDVVNYYPFRG